MADIEWEGTNRSDARTMTKIDSITSTSKFLSLVLRHQPQTVGVTPDRHGWVPIDELLEKCGACGHPITRALLEEVVATSPKQRFAISEDGLRVRANQGHSIEVELGYEPAQPPEWLFHGTIGSVLQAIRAEGLTKMSRHHVHLSADETTARAVGARRGRPIVLRIATGRMHDDGHVFFLSANGVWLTNHVPADYIVFPEP